MFKGIFDSKHVKLKTEDWEEIKTDYNRLIQENKNLRAQVSAGTSDEVAELKEIIAKQSESLKAMAKWKDNDDLIWHHEQMAQENTKKIKALEAQVESLTKDYEDLAFAYRKETEMCSLLAKKLATYTGSCPQYRTVSKLELYA